MELEALLYELGLSDSRAGFRCIIAAVEIALMDPCALTMVTKRLYPQTAQRCKTNWKAVERNIRTSINIVWSKDPHRLQELTGCPVHTKPTAAHFIAILAYFAQTAVPEQRRERFPVEGERDGQQTA